jgi:hypothetical protein
MTDYRYTDYHYAWRNGPRWVLGDLRRRRPVAALRTLRWTLFRGHIGETCQECGRPYLLWHADDALYGAVTGRYPRPDGESATGLFCLACFDRMARAEDIVLRWKPEISMSKKRPPRCGYLGCTHHKGHPGPHTWSEARWTDTRDTRPLSAEEMAELRAWMASRGGKPASRGFIAATRLLATLDALSTGSVSVTPDGHLFWQYVADPAEGGPA